MSRSLRRAFFWVLHSGGCENSPTDSVNQLTSSFFIPLLKLRTYSMEKILSLTGFICASSTNFPEQAVMLVLLAKQAALFHVHARPRVIRQIVSRL